MIFFFLMHVQNVNYKVQHMSDSVDRLVLQALAQCEDKLQQRQRGFLTDEDSASDQSQESVQTLIKTLRTAYRTYQTLQKVRQRTSVGGVALSALCFATKTYFGDTGRPAQSSNADGESRWLYFALGAAIALAVSSEVRWYCSDRHRYAETRQLAQTTATTLLRT